MSEMQEGKKTPIGGRSYISEKTDKFYKDQIGLTATEVVEILHEQKFDFIDNLTFSKALEAIIRGHSVKRKHWEEGAVVFLSEDRKWIRLRTYTIFTYYYLNHDDILAEDWEIIE